MFDQQKLKEYVDIKCDSLPQELLAYKTDIDAHELRDRILKLTSYISYFNELRDRAKIKVLLQERRIEYIKSIVAKKISLDARFDNLTAKLKELSMESYDLELDNNEKTSINNEKQILEWYTYASIRFSSRFEDIRTAIMSYVNILSFDKNEVKLG